MNLKYITGSSIIEIMLVIFISSLGVNYIFKTSLSSINSLHKSSQYLQASYATQDIANRILANYDIAKNTNAYIVEKFIIEPSDCEENKNIESCQNQLCSAENTANYDISTWKKRLACNLKNATAKIDATETNAITLYEITIEFNSVSSTANKPNKNEKTVKISTYQPI